MADTYLADYLNGLTSGTEYDEIVAALRTILGIVDGDWTPSPLFGGGNTGQTFSVSPVGKYAKRGNLYVARGTFTFSAKGSSTGAFTIAGLPGGPSANDGVPSGVVVHRAAGMSAISGGVAGGVPANSSAITLYQTANGASAALTSSNIGSSGSLDFTAFYQV